VLKIPEANLTRKQFYKKEAIMKMMDDQEIVLAKLKEAEDTKKRVKEGMAELYY
jgi:hypothetical protein